MNLIIKISWRNIMRHKGKSIVIGVILFLGHFHDRRQWSHFRQTEACRRILVEGFTGDALIFQKRIG